MTKKLPILFALIFLIEFASAITWDNTAYYKLDESSGAVIDATGHINGTDYGATAGVTGRINKSYRFDGSNDYIKVNNSTYLNPSNLTLSLWVNFAYSDITTKNYVYYIEKRDFATTKGYEIYTQYINLGNKPLYFRIYNGTTNTRIEYNIAGINTSLWHHIAGIYNGTGIALWLDGVPVTNHSSITLNNSNTPLNLGYDDEQVGDSEFNGSIDEVGIWNRSLSSAEIIELYNSGNGVPYLYEGIAPVLSVISPSGLSSPSNGNLTLNFNVTDANLASCWYNYNNTNRTVSCTNGTTASTNFTLTNQSNITVYANDTFGNSVSTTNYFNWNIKINIKDSDGNLVSLPHTTMNSIGLNTYENPIIRDSSYFTQNLTNNPVNVNITTTAENKDYTGTLNFNASQTEYNITLSGKQLTLNFKFYNGTSANVTGFWTDSEGNGANFTNTSLIKIQKDLAQGKVSVRWGWNQTLMNYTGNYEYENDWISETEENITVLNTGTMVYQYIKVMDDSGQPVNDALVRVSYYNPSLGNDSYKFMGQRFTGSDGTNGITSFTFDNSSIVAITVSAEGYGTINIPSIDIGKNAFTFTSPLPVTLRREADTFFQGVQANVNKYYNNTTEIIKLGIYAPSHANASFTTDYLKDMYGEDYTKPIVLNVFKIGYYNLTEGEDFLNTGTNPINITIYIDGEYWGTRIVTYKGMITGIEEPETGIDNGIIRFFAWILLIGGCAVLGLLVKGENSSNGAGGISKTIFLVGCLIYGIIFALNFGWLTIVSEIYFGLLIIKKWIEIG